MAMLNFSAEASLYLSSGHYRTRRQALSRFGKQNRLRPALERDDGPPPITVPGETIPVHSCPAGWSDIGGTCWPDPLTEPPSGGGESPGTPGVPSEDGPPGPGGGPPEPPKPKLTPCQRHVQAVGRAWRKQCEKETQGTPETMVGCCRRKEDTCILQYPKQHRKCTDYQRACMVEDYAA
jgi:hypothetical protein